MPLEPTDHRARRTKPISRRRLVLGSLLATSLLAGCAEGTRTDAERGKLEDKKRESVVDSLQATETYRIVNSSGGTPTPTPGE